MIILSIAGARVGVAGSKLRTLRRLGDEAEATTVVEVAVVEPLTRRRKGERICEGEHSGELNNGVES
jgi:hypothetical protein